MNVDSPTTMSPIYISDRIALLSIAEVDLLPPSRGPDPFSPGCDPFSAIYRLAGAASIALKEDRARPWQVSSYLHHRFCRQERL
jgi:hypothetical protein